MLDWDNGEINTRELLYLYLVQHRLHQIKAQPVFTDLDLYQLSYRK